MKCCQRTMFIGVDEGKKIFTCEVCGKQMEDRRLPENRELREFMQYYCVRREHKHPDGHLCDLPVKCPLWDDSRGCKHSEHPRVKANGNKL